MNRSFKKTESHLGLKINPKKPLTIGVTCPFLLTGPTYFFLNLVIKEVKKKIVWTSLDTRKTLKYQLHSADTERFAY